MTREVKIVERSKEWKDQLLGYHKYRIIDACACCGYRTQVSYWMTAEEARTYVPTCHACIYDMESAARESGLS